MKSRTSLHAIDTGAGPETRSLASRFAVIGTAAALVVGTAFVGATAANAASVLTVTTPANGATGVLQAAPNVVGFAGAGLPVADTVVVTYVGTASPATLASFSDSTVDASGNWSGLETFDRLAVDQTTVVATATAYLPPVDDNTAAAVDTTVTPATTTFTLATAPNPSTPFAVTNPVSNSGAVVSPKPTFSGTGTPGTTVSITYGARAGQNLIAGTGTVSATGTWSIAADFSALEPGQTDGTAVVSDLETDGSLAPGTSVQGVNFTFSSAPSPLIPLALITDPKSSTLSSATTKGVAFGATGFSPGEEVTVTVTDPSGSPVTLPKSAAHFFASVENGSFIGVVLLPTTAGTGTYTITVDGLRTARTVSGDFAVTADPITATAPTGTLPVVSG